MEGFTASKYKQLVLDKKPKINTTQLDKALAEGLESFTFYQNPIIYSSIEELEKEINDYLVKYKDDSCKIISKVEYIKNDTDNGLSSSNSKVVLSVIQKPTENNNNYLKEQGKKFTKEPKKSSKYDKKNRSN